MKEALHVASGKRILATEAEYEMYFGIFLCPDCKKSLHLRKSFTRNGKVTNASFIHPARDSSDEKCRYRVDWGVDEDEISNDGIDIHSKGQIFAALKQHFLSCFNNYKIQGSVKISENKEYSFNNKDLFEINQYKKTLVKTANKVLGLQNNYGLILLCQDLFTDIKKRNIKNLFQELPVVDEALNERVLVFSANTLIRNRRNETFGATLDEINTKLTDEELKVCQKFERKFFKTPYPLATPTFAVKLDDNGLKYQYPFSSQEKSGKYFFNFNVHNHVTTLVLEFLIFSAPDSLREMFFYYVFEDESIFWAMNHFSVDDLKGIYSTINKKSNRKPFKKTYTKLIEEFSKKEIKSRLVEDSKPHIAKNLILFILMVTILNVLNVNWSCGLSIKY